MAPLVPGIQSKKKRNDLAARALLNCDDSGAAILPASLTRNATNCGAFRSVRQSTSEVVATPPGRTM